MICNPNLFICSLTILEQTLAPAKDTELYVYLDAWKWMMDGKEQALEALSNPGIDYETLASLALNELARARGLSEKGDREAVIKRLRADDQKPNSKSKDKAFMRDAMKKLKASLKTHRETYDKAKKDLEKNIGHPILDITTALGRHKVVYKRDHEITKSYQPVHKSGPLCDYDWKGSQWAHKSERELREMCRRQGMKAWDSKAASIKWLETGSVEYEDLSAGSLSIMCMEREIKVNSHELRLDLARKLREDDELEIAHRVLGITALKNFYVQPSIIYNNFRTISLQLHRQDILPGVVKLLT
ncbi:hypothetical protein EYC84_005829 [Monilinia fructicola]|uniref:SAP domain-containing protein n=1 Tax=Monilinia fructicola TaxID=38448 RepID=A0A5M9K0Q1_MONFR|nr:hypothetical protein EYC84_005829 [Monilinia fructicola]